RSPSCGSARTIDSAQGEAAEIARAGLEHVLGEAEIPLEPGDRLSPGDGRRLGTLLAQLRTPLSQGANVVGAVIYQAHDLEQAFRRCGDLGEPRQIRFGENVIGDKTIEIFWSRVAIKDALQR